MNIVQDLSFNTVRVVNFHIRYMKCRQEIVGKYPVFTLYLNTWERNQIHKKSSS